MKLQPPSEGFHRDFHPNGVLREEYTIKNGRLHGVERKWHENGQLEEECVYVDGLEVGERRHWNSRGELLGTDHFKAGTGIARLWHENGQLSAEISCVRGEMTGRMRYWAENEMLYGTKYFFEGRPISKKKYLELCNADRSLPRFLDEKTANTIGNYMKRLRREKREQTKLGPTQEQLKEQQWFDEECAAEVKEVGSREVLTWLKKKTRGAKEIGEMTKGEVRIFARKLYALGAVKIWVAGIERDRDGSQYSKRLIVALPAEQAKIGRIYEFCTDPARPFLGGIGPAIRLGQKYMCVSLM